MGTPGGGGDVGAESGAFHGQLAQFGLHALLELAGGLFAGFGEGEGGGFVFAGELSLLALQLFTAFACRLGR